MKRSPAAFLSAVLVLGMVLGLAGDAARADSPFYTEQARLIPASLLPLLPPEKAVGAAVALSADGSVALVGSLNWPCPGLTTDCGAVYVFVRQGGAWVEESVLFPDTAGHPSRGQIFSNALALSPDGRTAFVSALFEDLVPFEIVGAVYVFERTDSGWVQRQKLRPSKPFNALRFGEKMALSPDGDLLLVTALPQFCPPDPDCGGVYVFALQNGTWVEETRLPVPAGSPSFFGSALAWAPDQRRVAIGAVGGFCGNIYRYVRSGTGTWTLLGEVSTSCAVGSSVAISPDGTELLAGTGNSVITFAASGDDWIEQGSFAPTPAVFNADFGHTLALGPGVALVGAPGSICPDLFINCGSAYVFLKRAGVWTQEQRLTGADPGEFNLIGDFFGTSLALSRSGAVALIGAPGEDCDGRGVDGCGGAYLYAAASIADIPTLSEAALLLLALGLAGCGTVLLARRRRLS